MKFSVKAMALSSSVLWGTAMLLVGLMNMAAPSYGVEFLRVMNSVYPGADAVPTLARVLLGALYGLVDGAAAGWVFGMLYSAFAHTTDQQVK